MQHATNEKDRAHRAHRHLKNLLDLANDGPFTVLTTEAIAATLRTVAACAPGSEIALSYAATRPFLDAVGLEFRETIERLIAQGGEPLQSDLSPDEAESLIVGCGLKVADHPTPDDLCHRYFAGRTDGLRPFTAERLITAVVAS